jgi:hypothetical protein
MQLMRRVFKFSRKIITCLAALVMFISVLGLGGAGTAWAKSDDSDAAEILIVNILNPDGTTTLVHEYSYDDLEAMEKTNYYATIDALPIGVGTKAKGVEIHTLIDDAAEKYNSEIEWKSGQKLVMYVTDYPTVAYQGSNYYTYDFLYGQERYYFPNLVATYNPEYSREEIDLDDPVSVAPMLASSSYQARWATDEDLQGEAVEMSDAESFRFCMGLTEAEVRDENFSSTNKFARWVYRVDVGPVNGARLTAAKTGNEVGQPLEITIAGVPTGWNDAVTQVKVDEIVLESGQYTITAEKLTINPGVFTADGTYTITVEADGFMNSTVDQAITASVNTFTVTFSPGENGSLAATVDNVNISSGGEVEAGKTVLFTATPNNGYRVKQWMVDDEVAVDHKTNTLTIENLASAKSVTVKFEAIPASFYSVTVDAGISGGTITVEPVSGSAGDTVIVTVTPDEGKQLVAGSLKYTADGGSTYTPITAAEDEYSFVMPAKDVTVSAQFENSISAVYSITKAPVPDLIWTVTVTIGQTEQDEAAKGETVTVTVTDTACTSWATGLIVAGESGTEYEFTTVTAATGDADGVNGPGIYSFVMPGEPVTVDFTADYTTLDVYIQYGAEGEESLVHAYTRAEMEALAAVNTESIHYAVYDRRPAVFMGKAVRYVTLEQLADDAVTYNSALRFDGPDCSLKGASMDGWTMGLDGLSWDYLMGQFRKYYAGIGDQYLAEENRTGKDREVPAVLAITGWAGRQEQVDGQPYDTLNTYRFFYGQTEAEYGSGELPAGDEMNARCTASNYSKSLNKIIFVVPEAVPQPAYTLTPQEDESYAIGKTDDGSSIMTVNPAVDGLKYFSVEVTPVVAHEGLETVVFVHYQGGLDGVQRSINATRADFDLASLDKAQAGFNVSPGDVVKVFIVDALTNAVDSNPIVLQ